MAWKRVREKVLELHAKGLSRGEIADALGVHKDTVKYHLDPVKRARVIELAKKNVKSVAWGKSVEGLAYNRAYLRERYRSDPVFRGKLFASMRKWKEKKKLERIRLKQAALVELDKSLKVVVCG